MAGVFSAVGDGTDTAGRYAPLRGQLLLPPQFFRGACRKKAESREGGLFVRQGSRCDTASREHPRPGGTADGSGHGVSGQGPQQEFIPGAVPFGQGLLAGQREHDIPVEEHVRGDDMPGQTGGGHAGRWSPLR